MLRTRVIPCLLLSNGRLVKTVRFKNPNYVGDPINTVRIFNTKAVDEIVFLDITATIQQQEPPFQLIKEIASECFMPFSYGGGIRTMEAVHLLFNLGVEKVVLNTACIQDENFISRISEKYGSQSVIVSMDVKKTLFGHYAVYTHGGRHRVAIDPLALALKMQASGAGELLLTAIHEDGRMGGYDLSLIKMISQALSIPVVASGGAASVDDFAKAVKIGGASAVAAGSMVVYQGKNRAVLTCFPNRDELIRALA